METILTLFAGIIAGSIIGAWLAYRLACTAADVANAIEREIAGE